MNGGEFKGSGLDKITGKPHDGRVVPGWYADKKYAEIDNYVRVEADEFVKVCSWLYRELPIMLARFKAENNLS